MEQQETPKFTTLIIEHGDVDVEALAESLKDAVEAHDGKIVLQSEGAAMGAVQVLVESHRSTVKNIQQLGEYLEQSLGSIKVKSALDELKEFYMAAMRAFPLPDLYRTKEQENAGGAPDLPVEVESFDDMPEEVQKLAQEEIDAAKNKAEAPVTEQN